MSRVAIVGSGPAALMAASVVSSEGIPVSLFEKRKGMGRKLLIAGSSGLNITNALPLEEFIGQYSGSRAFWRRILSAFAPGDWIGFIEKLGIPTFKGTSDRYFVEDMKASKLLQAWSEKLQEQGVQLNLGVECVGFGVEKQKKQVRLRFSGADTASFEAICFGLGGGSYEPQEQPLRWPSLFLEHGLGFSSFRPSNVGYHVAWSEAFLKEAEGLPIKGMALGSPKGARQGEVVITRYGMEGTPVYAVGQSGPVWLDLKPDLSAERILAKLKSVKENLSAIRRVKKQLNLDPAALALLFHCAPPDVLKDRDPSRLARLLKKFPLTFLEPRPLEEAISSAGGLHLEELDEKLMLKRFPGVFAAGEMLDWDAPTGGFLIQGCVSQGYAAGRGILRYLAGL